MQFYQAVREGRPGEVRHNRRLSRNHALRSDCEALRLVRLVARHRQVPVGLMITPDRGPSPVASARQLAIYLLHVALGRSYVEIAAIFERDRTTVAHACARVEDMCENPAFPEFDAELRRLERLIGETITGRGDRAEAGHGSH